VQLNSDPFVMTWKRFRSPSHPVYPGTAAARDTDMGIGLCSYLSGPPMVSSVSDPVGPYSKSLESGRGRTKAGAPNARNIKV
jgi:hypothetical protein